MKVADEQLFRIGPLALPTENSVQAARQAGAVALFEARAKAVEPQFALNADNVATAIDICRQLDGIALAIELAAARVPLLGLEGLRSRLGERFQVLISGNRLSLPRQQTLRAALEWSHGLLSTEQQTVFRRLGVFAGGFSLEAAQHVAADDSIDRWAGARRARRSGGQVACRRSAGLGHGTSVSVAGDDAPLRAGPA